MRVGVVGLGPMGLRHLHAFAEVVGPDRLVVAVRHADDRRRLTALPWPVATIDVSTGARLDANCDLAVVAMQTEHHAVVAAALRCALLVEKPLCQTPDQATELLARAARVFAGHSARAEAGAVALHARVAHGDIGAVRAVHVAWREPHLQRPDRGVPQQMGRLYDVGVHAASLVMEWFPDLTTATVASTWHQPAPGAVTLVSRAVWSDGAALDIEIGAAAIGEREVTVRGSTGTLRWRVVPGQSTLVLERNGSVIPIALAGPAPQVALARAVLAGLETGIATPFEGARGLQAMQWAGRWLAAVPAGEVEGAVFEWGWVR